MMNAQRAWSRQVEVEGPGPVLKPHRIVSHRMVRRCMDVRSYIVHGGPEGVLLIDDHRGASTRPCNEDAQAMEAREGSTDHCSVECSFDPAMCRFSGVYL